MINKLEMQEGISEYPVMGEERQKKSSQINVNMDVRMKSALQQIADEEGRSLSDVAYRALREWLRQKKSEDTAERDGL